MKQSLSHKHGEQSFLPHSWSDNLSQKSVKSVWHRLLSQNTLVPLLVVVMGLLLLGTPGAIAAWILTLIWSLWGVDEAFEALILSMFISIANSAIFEVLPLTTILRWLVFVLAVLRVGYEIITSGQIAWFPGKRVFLLFVVYVVISTVFVSPVMSLSLVKLTQFAVGLSIIYLGASHLTKRDWIYNIIGFGTVILIVSFIASFAGFGYERNARGFQGITIHPQTLGVILTITLAVAIAQWILKEAKITPVRLILLSSLSWALLLSEARTGVVALIISLSVSLFLMLTKKSMDFQRLAINPITYFAIAIVLVYLIVNPDLGQYVKNFFEKSSTVDLLQERQLFDNIGQIYYSSRGVIIENSLRNFRENPILGIGFGIPSHISLFESSLIAIYNLPGVIHVSDFIVWAETEKGFIGTAALEETGIIGTVLLLMFFLTHLILIQKRSDVVLMTLFVVAFAINIGEVVLFSFGGLGRYVILCMAIAVASTRSNDYALSHRNSSIRKHK